MGYIIVRNDEELAAERQAAEDQGVAYMYSRKSLQYSTEEVKEKLALGVPWMFFKVPTDQNIVMNDVIGDISFEANLISDFIVLN